MQFHGLTSEQTTGCSLVYTGWGVAFDGKYVQVLDSAANE